MERFRVEDLQLERAARRLLEVRRPERGAALPFVDLVGAARAVALDAIFAHASALSRAIAAEMPADRAVPASVSRALASALELSAAGPAQLGENARARTAAAVVLLNAVADVLAWLGGDPIEADATSPGDCGRGNDLAAVIPLFGRAPRVVEPGRLGATRALPAGSTGAPPALQSTATAATRWVAPTPAQSAARLSLESSARGMPGLDSVLRQLEGHVLDARFELVELARVGSQFAVFRGRDRAQAQPVAIKVPLVDYGRPISFGAREIAEGRKAALRAWQGLSSIEPVGTLLPRPIALVRAPNPLLRARGALAGAELFVIEEWLDDPNLDELRQTLFADSTAAQTRIEPTAAQARIESIAGATRAVVEALRALGARLFADVAPRNFLWSPGSARVRLVDAGSIVEEGTLLWEPAPAAGAPVRMVTPTTLVYLPASEIAGHTRGEARRLVRPTMLRAAGKMLHELATNRHPVMGLDPDASAPELALLPEPARRAIRLLLAGDSTVFANR